MKLSSTSRFVGFHIMKEIFKDIPGYQGYYQVSNIGNIRTNNNLSNLQIISNRENCSKDNINNSSEYTGVHWHKPSKRWRSQIRINNVKKHLGMFDTEIDAHNAYIEAVKNINNAT